MRTTALEELRFSRVLCLVWPGFPSQRTFRNFSLCLQIMMKTFVPVFFCYWVCVLSDISSYTKIANCFLPVAFLILLIGRLDSWFLFSLLLMTLFHCFRGTTSAFWESQAQLVCVLILNFLLLCALFLVFKFASIRVVDLCGCLMFGTCLNCVGGLRKKNGICRIESLKS